MFAWVHSVTPSGHRVHSGSRGITRGRLGVFGFMRVCMGSVGRD